MSSFWGAVAILAAEGKNVMCHMPSIATLNMLENHSIPCNELVIIKNDGWESDIDIRVVKKWAETKGIIIRMIDSFPVNYTNPHRKLKV